MSKIGRRFLGKGCLLFFIIAIMVVACGGGDDDGNDPVINNANLDGIWLGSYGDRSTVVYFFMNDGEMYGFDENGTIYDGDYTVSDSDDNFSASIQSVAADIEITGSGSEQGQINGTYVSSNGNTDDLKLAFDSDYNNPSSFELLAGEYAYEETNFSIDTDGGVTGTLYGECQISGAFSIIDSEHSLYGLDLDLSQCEVEGQYNGLARIDGDDICVAVFANTSYKLFMSGDRQ
ncbi:uncharacterized protein Dvar_15330 [Desulfosarcina variabilis str. Montpellier]|uniref:hypothetical protein n=1 Tax=Desulfosarcina variabilis TaxID=2300 RepID=UPI003AFB61A1